MSWCLINDKSKPVITAKEHIKSQHVKQINKTIPEICCIFNFGISIQYIESKFDTQVLIEKVPCFLDNPKCITIDGIENVCFIRGNYGSPAAVDLIETIIALGVKKIIIAGMCGGFSQDIKVGDVIIPSNILIEEGTSLHYYNKIKWIGPNKNLYNSANKYFSKTIIYNFKTVTTDAVYRQTFKKEAFWRRKKCVGVDMESSAILSVCKFYNIPAVSLLIVSDIHPMSSLETKWEWANNSFSEKRLKYIEDCVEFCRTL